MAVTDAPCPQLAFASKRAPRAPARIRSADARQGDTAPVFEPCAPFTPLPRAIWRNWEGAAIRSGRKVRTTLEPRPPHHFWRGLSQVRGGHATVLQPCLPSHGHHCLPSSNRVRLAVECPIGPLHCSHNLPGLGLLSSGLYRRVTPHYRLSSGRGVFHVGPHCTWGVFAAAVGRGGGGIYNSKWPVALIMMSSGPWGGLDSRLCQLPPIRGRRAGGGGCCTGRADPFSETLPPTYRHTPVHHPPMSSVKASTHAAASIGLLTVALQSPQLSSASYGTVLG